MSYTVNAIVTRPRGISGQYADGDVITDMPANQFEDWRRLGWVGRATTAQVEAHAEAQRAAALAAQEKAAATARPKKSRAAKPA